MSFNPTGRNPKTGVHLAQESMETGRSGRAVKHSIFLFCCVHLFIPGSLCRLASSAPLPSWAMWSPTLRSQSSFQGGEVIKYKHVWA